MDTISFKNALYQAGITQYYGVPDSTLKEFTKVRGMDISPNEGCAIGHAVGYHLATGKTPGVILQNSGIGNIMNPITSIVHEDIYDIPMVLIVGHRGHPSVKDEPQHKVMGRLSKKILLLMGFVVEEVDKDYEPLRIKAIIASNPRVAFLVTPGAFDNIKSTSISKTEDPKISREGAIRDIVVNHPGATFIATTGMIGRELFSVRESLGQSHDTDFLCVGGMGHASSIALTYAIYQPHKTVVLLDGDGAMMMHLGSTAMVGMYMPENLFHILLDNHQHASVGGGDTHTDELDMESLIKGFKYKSSEFIDRSRDDAEPSYKAKFTHIIVGSSNRPDLGRPTLTPREQKLNFMNL